MRRRKLAAMVILTTLLATILCWLAMHITTIRWTEPINYEEAALYWGWLAFFHLVVFMVPLTLALEPNPFSLRWLYYGLSVLIALGWTVLLDGPEQLVSYLCAILIGLACAAFWVHLLKRMRPWGQSHA